MTAPADTADARHLSARRIKEVLFGSSRRRNGVDEERWVPYAEMLAALRHERARQRSARWPWYEQTRQHDDTPMIVETIEANRPERMRRNPPA